MQSKIQKNGFNFHTVLQCTCLNNPGHMQTTYGVYTVLLAFSKQRFAIWRNVHVTRLEFYSEFCPTLKSEIM